MKHNSDFFFIFLYRLYLKRLVRLQERVLRVRTKRKVHTNLRPEMSGCYFNWKITKYFNYVIFYFSWHNTLTAHDSNLICRVPTVCQVTVHKEYSKFPPSKSTHAWTLLIKECRTLSKVQGRLRMVWRASTKHRWSASSFQCLPLRTKM